LITRYIYFNTSQNLSAIVSNIANYNNAEAAVKEIAKF